MIFVGREIETEHITKELYQGKNIIVGGKFGIGRTSMIKEIASSLQNEWRFIFVDFSQTNRQTMGIQIHALSHCQCQSAKKKEYCDSF
jgi:MoxR-like ATPase